MDNSVDRSREPAREASSEKFRSREKGFDIVPKCLVAGKLARFEIEKFPSSSIRRRYLSSKDFFENMDILRRKSTGNVIPRTRTRKREREIRPFEEIPRTDLQSQDYGSCIEKPLCLYFGISI